MIQLLLTEFVIQELKELLDITQFNNLLNSTIQLKELKKKYYYWCINSKNGNFQNIYTKIKSRIQNEKDRKSVV